MRLTDSLACFFFLQNLNGCWKKGYHFNKNECFEETDIFINADFETCARIF